MRRIEPSLVRWSASQPGSDEQEEFAIEVLRVCRDLEDGRDDFDRQKVNAQAVETVKRRWGIERYAAIRDGESRSWARNARQRANSGTDGPAVSDRAKRRRLGAGTD